MTFGLFVVFVWIGILCAILKILNSMYIGRQKRAKNLKKIENSPKLWQKYHIFRLLKISLSIVKRASKWYCIKFQVLFLKGIFSRTNVLRLVSVDIWKLITVISLIGSSWNLHRTLIEVLRVYHPTHFKSICSIVFREVILKKKRGLLCHAR